jgi:hypothetical protein
MELDYEDAKVMRRLEQAWASQSRRRLWELMEASSGLSAS